MVVISLIVLLVMVGVWIWFHFTSVEPITSYYWENVESLLNVVDREDWDTAERDIEFYRQKWDGERKLWVYFINQDEIDSIDISMKRSLSYIKNKDKNKAQAELEHLRILFNIIKENECLALDNIF